MEYVYIYIHICINNDNNTVYILFLVNKALKAEILNYIYTVTNIFTVILYIQSFLSIC